MTLAAKALLDSRVSFGTAIRSAFPAYTVKDGQGRPHLATTTVAQHCNKLARSDSVKRPTLLGHAAEEGPFTATVGDTRH